MIPAPAPSFDHAIIFGVAAFALAVVAAIIGAAFMGGC